MEIMEISNQKFEVIKLLGKGKGGYSYLVQKEGKNYVLKQIHHEPCDYYTFGNKIEAEERDYNRLSKIGIRMPKLLMINHQEERILKEYIEGDTIYSLVQKDQMKAVYLEQIEAMCNLLYKAHTNIDYFPTNFVVQGDLLYYIDYECNDYMEEWDFKHWGVQYWSKTQSFLEYQMKKHLELI